MTPRSIQTSLSRWFAMQAFLGLSIACTVVYATTRWSFQLKQDEEFERYRELVAHAVEENRSPPDVEALRHKLGDFFSKHLAVTVDLRTGREVLFVSRLAEDASRSATRIFDLPDLSFEGRPVQLTLTQDVSSDDRLLRRLAWTLVAVTVLGSIVVSVTGALLVRRGLKPLTALAAQTAAVGPDQPGRRINQAGYADELRPWIDQFNGLLERVESAYGQLEAFNADVAHALRTPLANMIAQAEVELSQARPVSALRDALASVLEEAQRLSAIVADMLFLSKADRGAQARRTGPVHMAEQMAAVAEFHEFELDEARLSLVIDGDTSMHVDIGLLRRAVSNLVTNAIRYATPVTTIRVLIRRHGTMVEVSVENRGEAISQAQIPYIFERFFRADRARSSSSSHHGLGLAIVAAIARMHGGSTFAESAGGWTRIGLLLDDAESP